MESLVIPETVLVKMVLQSPLLEVELCRVLFVGPRNSCNRPLGERVAIVHKTGQF